MEYKKIPAMIMAGYPGMDNKALWELHGKPMLTYCLEALRGCKWVSEIVVVGDPSIMSGLIQNERCVEGRQRLVDNAVLGSEMFPDAELVMYISSDIPLITAHTLDRFIEAGQDTGAELVYPIIERSCHEAAYPDCKRTYAKLREGSFTGGNAYLMSPRIMQRGYSMAESLISGRKNPFLLARRLGVGILWGLLTHKLKIAQAEKRLRRLLKGLPVKALIFDDASLGNDLDRIEEKPLFEAYIAKRMG